MAAERMRERGSTETVGICIMKEVNSTKLIDRSKRMSLGSKKEQKRQQLSDETKRKSWI